MPHTDANIWIQMYEDTPFLLRWTLMVLSLGLLSAYHYFWKRSQARLSAIEKRERTYITRRDFASMDDKVDKIMFHLMGDQDG